MNSCLLKIEHLLDILPKEIVYVIYSFLTEMTISESLFTSSEYMSYCYNSYKRDIVNGAINPFNKFPVSIKFKETNYRGRVFTYSICNTPSYRDRNVSNLSDIFKINKSTVDIKNIECVYFAFTKIINTSISLGILIYDINQETICHIITDNIKKIYKGRNWYEMWNKLDETNKSIVLKHKLITENNY